MRGAGPHVYDSAGKRYLDALSGLFVVQVGHGRTELAEAAAKQATKETFDAAESERLLRGFLSRALFDAGLYCRADDRGDPVIQLAPPLICDESHFVEIEQILRAVLTEAWTRI